MGVRDGFSGVAEALGEGDIDTIADALGHRARRRVLIQLLEQNPLDRKAAAEADGERASEVKMVHVHLPKLDETGYVSWDRDGDTVMKGPNWEVIEPFLQLLYENRDRLPDDAF